jgi:hypothetical protein
MLLLIVASTRHEIVTTIWIVSSLVVARLTIHLKGDALGLTAAITRLPLVLILHGCLVW